MFSGGDMNSRFQSLYMGLYAWQTKQFQSMLCFSQTEENEELRRAHNRRRERLLLVQKNYKAVKNQLKAAEKANDTYVQCFYVDLIKLRMLEQYFIQKLEGGAH